MIIGSHVSMSGKKMFLGSVETSIENGANALMIYTGAPQNNAAKQLKIYVFLKDAPYLQNMILKTSWFMPHTLLI